MHQIIVFLATTPAPAPSLRPGISPEDVTPGTLGFIMTLFFVLATTLLLVDMVRRVRRVRYRAQVEEERLAAAGEADASLESRAAGEDAGPGPSPAATPTDAPGHPQNDGHHRGEPGAR